MATNFSVSHDEECEMKGCGHTSEVKYYVSENQRLCDGCATQKGYAIQSREQTHEWPCDKHKKRIIEFYCKDHEYDKREPHLACIACIPVRHQHCGVIDIADAIKEKKKQLEDTHHNLAQTQAGLTRLLQEKDTIWHGVEEHLTKIKSEVNAQFDVEIEKEIEKERLGFELKINQEADDKIKKINEKREAELALVREKADERRVPLDRRREEIIADLEAIGKSYRKELDGLTAKLKENSGPLKLQMCSNLETAETLLKDDRKLLIEANTFLISDNRGNIYLCQDLANKEKVLTQNVLTVKYFRDPDSSLTAGRLDGLVGTWKVIDTFEIPEINKPIICGHIDDSHVVLSTKEKGGLYEANLQDKTLRTIQQPMTGNDQSTLITSCVVLNDDVIAVGGGRKRNGENEGVITFYNRDWEQQKEISIPLPTRDSLPYFQVDVNADRQINALMDDDIHNPSEGPNPKHTITTSLLTIDPCLNGVDSIVGKVPLTVPEEYHLQEAQTIKNLPSGEILLHTTNRGTVLQIEQSGNVQPFPRHRCTFPETNRVDKLNIFDMAVDKLTGMIYGPTATGGSVRSMCQSTNTGVYLKANFAVDSHDSDNGWSKTGRDDQGTISSICVTPSGYVVTLENPRGNYPRTSKPTLAVYRKSFISE